MWVRCAFPFSTGWRLFTGMDEKSEIGQRTEAQSSVRESIVRPATADEITRDIVVAMISKSSTYGPGAISSRNTSRAVGALVDAYRKIHSVVVESFERRPKAPESADNGSVERAGKARERAIRDSD